MVNATQSKSCGKCKSTRHETKDCKASHCTLCDQYWHTLEQCFLNPKSPNYKGAEAAAQLWKKLGKKPPAPTPGNSVGAAFTVHKGSHIRIRATIPQADQQIVIIPDSGSSVNLASGASCRSWGLCVESRRPGEAHLFDIQGFIIPIIGRASVDIFIPSRGVRTSVSFVVADVPDLEGLVVGCQALQAWGILQLQPSAVTPPCLLYTSPSPRD